MLKNLKFKDYVSGLFQTVQPLQYIYNEHPLGYPLDKDDYCDAWVVTKSEGVEFAHHALETTRPILLRYGDDYRAYWHVNGDWYQIGDTTMSIPLGRKLRHITRYEHRSVAAFYNLLKLYKRTIKTAELDAVIQLHKQLNLFGYHVRMGSRQTGPSQWRWVKLESEYLQAIKITHGKLVDAGVKINHFTIDWTDLN